MSPSPELLSIAEEERQIEAEYAQAKDLHFAADALEVAAKICAVDDAIDRTTTILDRIHARR